MRIRRPALAFGIAIALLSSAARAQAPEQGLTLAQIYSRAAPSTVLIRATFESKETGEIVHEEGSGFFINQRGFLVTAQHVVTTEDQAICAKGGCRVKLTGHIGSRAAAGVPLEQVDLKTDADIALLRVTSPPDETPRPLAMGTPIRTKVGDEIVALGFPLGFNLQPKPGNVLDVHGPHGNWVTDVPLNPGDSGGPVVDSSGNVVGIVGGGFKDAAGINYVVPLYLANLSSFLETGGAKGEDCKPQAVGANGLMGEWAVMRTVPGSNSASVPTRSYVARTEVPRAACGAQCAPGEDMLRIHFSTGNDKERIATADSSCEGAKCSTVEYDGPSIIDEGKRVTLGIRSRDGPVAIRLTAHISRLTIEMIRQRMAGGEVHYEKPFSVTMPDSGAPTLLFKSPYQSTELTGYSLAAGRRPTWLQQLGEPERTATETTYKLKVDAPAGCTR
jgi:hypothetical protein